MPAAEGRDRTRVHLLDGSMTGTAGLWKGDAIKTVVTGSPQVWDRNLHYSPSSPALQSLISRPHSDFNTCEAVMRREGLGSKME